MNRRAIKATLHEKAVSDRRTEYGDFVMTSIKALKRQSTVGRAALAEILDVSKTTVDNWYLRGVPFHEVGKRKMFVVAEVVYWLRERDVEQAVACGRRQDGAIDLDELRRRRALADTELAELGLEEARSQVVPYDIVIEEVGDSFTRVRAKLLTMKSRYDGQWARIHNVAKQKAAIEKAVYEILEELTSPEAVADPAADDGRRKPRVRGVSSHRISGRRPGNRPPAETENVPK